MNKEMINKLKNMNVNIVAVSKYHTKEEIDVFVEACKHGGDFLDAFFK